MNNKKGQELSTNAIILIVLGVLVLVLLILGFTIGWDRILPFIKTNNVQNVVAACETACSTSAQYDYCNAPKEVNNGVDKKISSTCLELSTKADYSKYGIKACPSIACPAA